MTNTTLTDAEILAMLSVSEERWDGKRSITTPAILRELCENHYSIAGFYVHDEEHHEEGHSIFSVTTAMFTGCLFYQVHLGLLPKVKFSECVLQSCHLPYHFGHTDRLPYGSGVTFSTSRFNYVDFTKTSLQNVSFFSCTFFACDGVRAISPIGSDKEQLVAWLEPETTKLQVNRGCFSGNKKAFFDSMSPDYFPLLREEYVAAFRYLEAWREIELKMREVREKAKPA